MAQQHGEQFDVSSMELFEHVPDPAAMIATSSRLFNPGGMHCFSTINRTAKAYLFAIFGAEYLLRLLPKGTHDYAKFIRPIESSGG